jgi:hypothetical protein
MSSRKVVNVINYIQKMLETIEKKHKINLEQYIKPLEKDISKIIIKKKEPVKKPDTAYRAFSKEYTEKIKKNNKEIKFGEINKQLSDKWKNIKNKDKYENLAKIDKKRYLEEIYSLQKSEDKTDLLIKNGIFKIKDNIIIDDMYDLDIKELLFIASSFTPQKDLSKFDKTELIDFIEDYQKEEKFISLNLKTISKKFAIIISPLIGIDVYLLKKMNKKEIQDYLQEMIKNDEDFITDKHDNVLNKDEDEDEIINKGNEKIINKNDEEIDKKYEDEELDQELDDEEEEEEENEYEEEDELDEELKKQGLKKSKPFK